MSELTASEPQKVYSPLLNIQWDGFKINGVALSGPVFGSYAFVPVYETREACEAQFPGVEVRVDEVVPTCEQIAATAAGESDGDTSI